MGRYGNIDGIATLTNNPNATDNAKRRVSESKQVHLICRAEAVSPQAKGTIGKRNGIWGDAVKMEEVGITEITEEHLVEIVKEMFTKK